MIALTKITAIEKEYRRSRRAQIGVGNSAGCADLGPKPLMAVRDRNIVTVSFASLEKGLAIYESNRAIGFQVCGETKLCTYVNAVAREGEIDLDVSHIKDAAFVRFCWADSPICNVYNSAGLPAVPFELPITEVVRARK